LICRTLQPLAEKLTPFHVLFDVKKLNR